MLRSLYKYWRYYKVSICNLANNRNEPYVNETRMVHENIPDASISLEKLNAVAAATCKIFNENLTGTGFLVRLPISLNERNLCGLMTNNHVLGKNDIMDGGKLHLKFEYPVKREVEIQITPGCFRFTSPLLDVTFVEIDSINLSFLETNSTITKKQKAFIVQFPKEENLSFAQGCIRAFWGFDIIHEISTGSGSSGSALFDFNGKVIGVHKQANQNENCNIATDIRVVVSAIQSLVNSGKTDLDITIGDAKTLSEQEIQELGEHGLQPTTNHDIFISPASTLVTQLWFYRSNHAWYWTPKNPENYQMKYLSLSNWTITEKDFPCKAIGGLWDGDKPKDRNVELINWLSRTGLRFIA